MGGFDGGVIGALRAKGGRETAPIRGTGLARGGLRPAPDAVLGAAICPMNTLDFVMPGGGICFLCGYEKAGWDSDV